MDIFQLFAGRNPSWISFLCISVSVFNIRCHHKPGKNNFRFKFKSSILILIFISDPQMVTYLLWSARLGANSTEQSYHSTSKASSNSSRFTSRDIFLYYNRMVKLAAWKNQVDSFKLFLHRHLLQCLFHNSPLDFGRLWSQPSNS